MNRPYHQDLYGWTQDQVDALRRRSLNEIDWDNLLEEIAALGRSEESELINRLVILVSHLLKWRLQPDRRSRSWAFTIREQRRRIDRLLTRNPSLRPILQQALLEAYPSAVERAAEETGMAETAFTNPPSLTFDAAMAEPAEWEPPGS